MNGEALFENGRVALSAVLGTLAALLGGWDIPLAVFASVTLADSFLGTLFALARGKFSWTLAVDGATRKAGHVVLIGVAYGLDSVGAYYAAQAGARELNLPLHEITACYYIISETASLVRQVGDAPKALTAALDKLRGIIGEGAPQS